MMKSINNELIKKLINKASKSLCRYKVSAIGFDKNGKYLGCSVNEFSPSMRLSDRGVGIHAEMNLIKRYRDKLKSIIICRVGNSGILRPIKPCKACHNCATKLGITIYTLKLEENKKI